MSEMDNSLPIQYFINSILPDRNEVDEEFIKIELEFKFTNLTRLGKLLRFLQKIKIDPDEKFKPILMFIRNENEDIYETYKYSKRLNKRGFAKIKEGEIFYWAKISHNYGI